MFWWIYILIVFRYWVRNSGSNIRTVWVLKFADFTNCYFLKYTSLREKCLNTEFLVHIFPHSDWVPRVTEYLSVFSPNAGKYGSEKTPYLDTFHTVLMSETIRLTSVWKIPLITSGAITSWTLNISKTNFCEFLLRNVEEYCMILVHNSQGSLFVHIINAIIQPSAMIFEMRLTNSEYCAF